MSVSEVSTLSAIASALPETIGSRTRTAVLDDLRALSAARAPGTAQIAIRRPDDGGGFAAVQVVTDDMVGLVDAVSALVGALHADVVDLVHPVVGVVRESDGTLTEVTAAGAPSSSPESWIHIALRVGTPPSVFDAIAVDLPTALEVVRSVDADTEAMGHVRVSVAAAVADPDTAALLQWLSEDRFRLLGYRCRGGNCAAPASLGIDRDTVDQSPSSDGPSFELEQAPLASPVLRTRVPYVLVVREHGADEAARREHRFTGLFTVAALATDVMSIPVVGDRVRAAIVGAGHTLDSHSGASMATTARAFPLPELLSVDSVALSTALVAVDALGVRREVVLFLRPDPDGRYVSAILFLPREGYTTRVVDRAGDILREAYGGESVEVAAWVSESPVASVSFVIRLAEPLPRTLDTSESTRVRLQATIGEATRTWEDGLLDEAERTTGSVEDLMEFAEILPDSYKEDFGARRAMADLTRVCSMTAGTIDTLLYRAAGEPADRWRFSLYATGVEISLGQVLPVLQSLGVEVIDERPYEFTTAAGGRCRIYDFGLLVGPDLVAGSIAAEVAVELVGADITGQGPGARRVTEAFEALWRGEAQADRFNELILRAGLHWREVLVLRAYAKFLRQAGFTYSQYTIESVLIADPRSARLLAALFTALFDPDSADPQRAADIDAELVSILDRVVSLDTDRILRALLSLVRATMRTNHYMVVDDAPRPMLSLKLDSRAVDELPAPRPHFEIFVYSPRLEGVHLRFGPVARGGLRWSDRREDFRTEVLGLAKAQTVKNAVIVPVGAKGGFVVKNPPHPTGDPGLDRAAALAEGQECYRWFVRGLLDVTDNLDRTTGAVLAPDRVVRRDGDDTYLVVAADKGTASFSDIANSVAAEYDFWLGDAFASGGSVGYDHKAMGITAKGAWVSVTRHFRELGLDPAVDEITVVGVGDMSGDVFGNGMLLSNRLKVVAAFDHRHIFLDPDPNPARSFDERARLFALPRSSWADFDASVISEGGGVWERTRKSIPIGPRVREVLGIEGETAALSPDAMISAILLAPADLLWNGGIGTYVKARAQSDAEVGDKANDAVRVDAADLRVKVVGEGGNLGFTPAGRIEFARAGGRLNTDAVDNSAGVDCSDHEVNIKILLDSAVAAGELRPGERGELLASMTDEVASLVLADNKAQNEVLGTSRADAVDLMNVHARLISDLVDRVGLDTELEALPSRHEAARRIKHQEGLSSPELATVMAHVKLALQHDLAGTDLPDSDAFVGEVTEYFPVPLRERFGSFIAAHPLRRSIVATRLANRVIDQAGITYAFRLGEDSGVSATDAVRAFTVTTAVFRLPLVWGTIAATEMPSQASDLLVLESRRLLDRGSRWLLANRPQPVAVRAEITRFGERIARLEPHVTGWLGTRRIERAAHRARSAIDAGAPVDLAVRIHGLLDQFCLLDIIESADISDHQDAEVAELYFRLDDILGIDRLLTAVSRLERGDRWHSLARLALRDDLYTSLRALTLDVLHGGETGESAGEMIEDWESGNASRLRRARAILADIEAEPNLDLATLSVAAGQVRSMVRVTGSRSEGSE